MGSILHYIFDPFCGWCYGATPLVEAALGMPGVTLALHASGMLIGPNRRVITHEMREFLQVHDHRIAQLSGRVFGASYSDGLLRENGTVLDSEPPTVAILAAEMLAGRGVAMLDRVQRALFVEGRRISDPSVLTLLAFDLGISSQPFRKVYSQLEGLPTRQHIRASRQLLQSVGGIGVPTLVLEEEQGAMRTLDLGFWLGRPAAFLHDLTAGGAVPDVQP